MSGVNCGSWDGNCSQQLSAAESEVLLMRDGMNTVLAMIEVRKGWQELINDGCQKDRRLKMGRDYSSDKVLYSGASAYISAWRHREHRGYMELVSSLLS